MAGVDGVDEEELSTSDKQSDGTGDETTEFVLETTGDRTIGEPGSKGLKRVGPSGFRWPLLKSGDGLFSASATRATRAGNDFLLLALLS